MDETIKNIRKNISDTKEIAQGITVNLNKIIKLLIDFKNLK